MTEQPLHDNSKVRIHPQILLRHVDDEAVLLNLDDGTYYGLNAVGARMVEVLHQSSSIGAAYELLQQEYEVDAARLRKDLDQLLGEMRSRGLVTIEP